jgi:type II secretory ATPase GspE/PulE/Tfp pilus assembly ATPase PilB-like protein
MGIFELMGVNEANVIREQARKSGMKTLRQDGFDKVLAGLTTLDEVLRVTTEEAAVTQE